MFGYLRVDKPELLVREFEAYKSVYCGLCKQLGKSYSFPARFMLSYDCTFYAMLIMSLHRSCTGFKDGRCVFNPLKRCKFAQCSGNAYESAAAFTVISAYYKLLDNIADSGFVKSIFYRALKPVFSHYRKKALRRGACDYIDDALREMTKLQAEEENNTGAGIDSSAHPTAHMLGTVFEHEAETEDDARIFYEMGYHLGRWIYFADAADDLKRDEKSGGFNPFLHCGNTDPDYINSVLSISLARAVSAYNLIDICDFKGITDNMMLRGFPRQQEIIIKKLKENLK